MLINSRLSSLSSSGRVRNEVDVHVGSTPPSERAVPKTTFCNLGRPTRAATTDASSGLPWLGDPSPSPAAHRLEDPCWHWQIWIWSADLEVWYNMMHVNSTPKTAVPSQFSSDSSHSCFATSGLLLLISCQHTEYVEYYYRSPDLGLV